MDSRDYLNQIRIESSLEPITDQVMDLKEFKDLQYDKLAVVIRDSSIWRRFFTSLWTEKSFYYNLHKVWDKGFTCLYGGDRVSKHIFV